MRKGLNSGCWAGHDNYCRLKTFSWSKFVLNFTRFACETTPLGVEQCNWGVRGCCEPPGGVWGEAPPLLAISPFMAVNRAFLRTLKWFLITLF